MEWPADINIDEIEDPAMRMMLRMIRSMFEQLQASANLLQTTIDELREQLKHKDEENAQLKKALFGQKRERSPRVTPPKDEARRGRKLTPEEKEAKRKRVEAERERKRNERRAKLPVVEQIIEVPQEELICGECGGRDFVLLGTEISERFEHIPEHLLRQVFIRQKMACSCGECIKTAAAPENVIDGGLYGPGFHAHVAVSKCSDALPLNRLSKILRRAGAEVNTSTLGDIFHRVASLCEPLYLRILEKVAASPIVNADETKQPVKAKKKCRKASMWTFISDRYVGFLYSPTGSGKTPEDLLAQTTGILQVDGDSCFNATCEPKGKRKRAGCWGHARRKFFAAQNTAPKESKHALAEILALYKVEYRAAELDLLGSDRHQALRQVESKAITERFKSWLDEQQPRHPPKSPLGKAIKYAQNQWETLIVFLDNAKIALDNNLSERALRVIAMGRKNFLFVGNDEAGRNLAILQTVVSTCIACDVNPYEYLRDVLIRMQTHPMEQVDEILPDRWRPPDSETSEPDPAS